MPGADSVLRPRPSRRRPEWGDSPGTTNSTLQEPEPPARRAGARLVCATALEWEPSCPVQNGESEAGPEGGHGAESGGRGRSGCARLRGRGRRVCGCRTQKTQPGGAGRRVHAGKLTARPRAPGRLWVCVVGRTAGRRRGRPSQRRFCRAQAHGAERRKRLWCAAGARGRGGGAVGTPGRPPPPGAPREACPALRAGQAPATRNPAPGVLVLGPLRSSAAAAHELLFGDFFAVLLEPGIFLDRSCAQGGAGGGTRRPPPSPPGIFMTR